MLTQLNRLLVLLALCGLLHRPAMAKAEEPQTLVIDGDTLVVQMTELLPAGLQTLVVDGDTLIVQVLAESLPEDDPPLVASDKRLVGPAQAVSMDSSASVQVQTPTQAEIDSLSAKMEARINRNLRIAKKVAAGTASGGVFTFSAIGFMALTIGDGYADDDLAGLGNLLASVAIGCSVGFPLGVTLVDPYDSLSETLFSGVIPGAIGMSLVRSGDGSGFLMAYVGPIIGSLYASEKSRQPPQDHRVFFGLAPTFNGGLSAVAQLRF